MSNKRSKLHHQSITSIDSFDVDEILPLFALADSFQLNNPPQLTNKIVALAFFEPSTRTSCSFAAAAQRLGCGVIHTNSTDSSMTKGETLSDTIHCLASYSDCIVMRHPTKGSALLASEAACPIPVMNAGDGTGEHPTQALLDVYTMFRHGLFVPNKPMNITFLGDAKNGRTIHSLIKLLAKVMPHCHVRYVTPVELKIPQDIRALPLEQYEFQEMTSEILKVTDVLYVTRVQKERFADLEAYLEAMKKCCIVTAEVMKELNPKAIVMHPLPRVDEIATEVDVDPRAVYFEQMKNGMFLRMALLHSVLN
jgi:carbamoyl-phosphate synthase/aspartate carbamoyltransferase